MSSQVTIFARPRAVLRKAIEEAVARVARFSLPTGRTRFLVYAVVLAVFGSWVCFHHLGRGMLNSDEASFAYTTDRMLGTGDWVGAVHRCAEAASQCRAALQLALLHHLAALRREQPEVSRVVGGVWRRVRAHGAGAGDAPLPRGGGARRGVAPPDGLELDLLARPRWGVMESTLAFFILAMVVCYVRTIQAPDRARKWWGLLGVSFGLAILTKPPVIGGFFFCMLAGHHLLTRRDLAWKQRLRGSLVAGLIAALVAIPWYAAITLRLGPHALDQLLVANSIGRARPKQINHAPLPPTCYFTQVWDSSVSGKISLIAIGFGAGCVLLRSNRRAWSILLMAAVPYILAISGAAEKHLHYVYYALPLHGPRRRCSSLDRLLAEGHAKVSAWSMDRGAGWPGRESLPQSSF